MALVGVVAAFVKMVYEVDRDLRTLKTESDKMIAHLEKENKELDDRSINTIRQLKNELDTTVNRLAAMETNYSSMRNDKDTLETRCFSYQSDMVAQNERITEIEKEVVPLRKEIADLRQSPKRKYQLTAKVTAHSAGNGAKVTSYTLTLVFVGETDVKSFVEVRTLAASKAAKEALETSAGQINAAIERLVESKV